MERLPDSGDVSHRVPHWEEFLRAHTKLLLHVARSFGGDHDAVMDRFTYLLGQLQRDDYRRLRAYAATDRSEFSTWLVVVAQRIYLDHERAVYGRFRSRATESPAQEEERIARRRLVDLIGAEVNLDEVIDRGGRDAEASLREDELHRALAAALAALEPRDRLLLKLRFEDSLTMPDVARALGLPTRFHAYRQLRQALASLRQALERSGVSDATP